MACNHISGVSCRECGWPAYAVPLANEYPCPHCSSLRARAEEAEAALCRAREAITLLLNKDESYERQWGKGKRAHDVARSVLNDTTPCPHEAEVNRLEQFIEKRLEHCVSDQRGAYQDVLDEFRRRAGEGK